MGWYDTGLGVWVNDHSHRRKIMKSKGLEEVGSIKEVEEHVARKRREKQLSEADYKALVAEAIRIAEYDKKVRYETMIKERISRYNEMMVDYNSGRMDFSSIIR